MQKTASFRKEIEGLRAVAVLFVIGFHYLDLRNAGFIGVDVFFVISGYLICGLIMKEEHDKSFSFAAFYGRRIRRILPALLVVLVASMAAGWVLLPPSGLEDLGAQAGAATIGVANIYFWAKSGYFAADANTIALLHTWSLGVEEQFYLIWPLIIVLCLPWLGRKGLGIVTAIIAIASFALMIALTDENSAAGFYLSPARAWQLALGGLVALAAPITNRFLSELLRAGSLALLILSVLLIDPNEVYPSYLALLPTMAACGLVWLTTTPSFVDRALALPPLRYIGRISYSLYLWHWPVLVFFMIWNIGGTPTLFEAGVLLLISLAFSHVTWRFVEMPARRNGPKAFTKTLTIVGTGATVGALGMALFALNGVPARLGAQAATVANHSDRQYTELSGSRCKVMDSDNEYNDCVFAQTDLTRVLLIGDSHANHLISALLDNFSDIDLHLATESGCRPVIAPTGRDSCVALQSRVISELIPMGAYEAVIIAARWRNGQSDQIAETVAHIGQHTPKVFVIGPVVEYDLPLPDLLLAGFLPRREFDQADYQKRWPEIWEIDQVMANQLSNSEAKYLSVIAAMCTDDTCQTVTDDGIPMSWDYGHFNPTGADVVINRLQGMGLVLQD